ncbi:MAG: molybdate ABC transporter substrate-binding protein [Acidobacteriota bacterium]|nr:molybdate ABC transporter substrate-binding protein [Acidobacteriota bacterium]
MALTLVAIFGLLLSGTAFAQQHEVMIYAAASMKNVLDDIGTQYKAQTGKSIKVSLAASSALAKQIENGAPGDIFISADLDWMDYLAQRKLIKPETRKNLLGNQLVLIAPLESDAWAKIKPGFPLAKLLKGGKLAMGNTSSVPAGKYGKTALEKLGVWGSVQNQIAQAESVRAALALVARGEAPLGIVYKTDAEVEPHVKIVGVFPEDSHPPIIYPVALLSDSHNHDAAAFLAYLESPKCKPIFQKYGFNVLK